MPTAFQHFTDRDFTLAATADATILARAKAAIGRALETGREVSTAPDDIREILKSAGCLPANPNYPETVLRTNMMGSFSDSHEDSFNDPDVQAAFPVWRYDGIEDGREGDDHRPNFGKYYPANVSFSSVRGPRIYNCRCVRTPVYWREWERLKARGARLADGYVEMPRSRKPFPRILLPGTLTERLPKTLRSARTLSDLTASSEGRIWLRTNKAAARRELLGPKPRKPADKSTLPIPEPARRGTAGSLASKKQIDDLVGRGWKEAFRGVSDPAHAAAMRQGVPFEGQGDYGNGIYLTTDLWTAESYASDPESNADGAVIRVAISPAAKLVRVEDVERMHSEAVGRGDISATMDLGTFARSQGIDGITVPHKAYINIVNPPVIKVQR